MRSKNPEFTPKTSRSHHHSVEPQNSVNVVVINESDRHQQERLRIRALEQEILYERSIWVTKTQSYHAKMALLQTTIFNINNKEQNTLYTAPVPRDQELRLMTAYFSNIQLLESDLSNCREVNRRLQQEIHNLDRTIQEYQQELARIEVYQSHLDYLQGCSSLSIEQLAPLRAHPAGKFACSRFQDFPRNRDHKTIPEVALERSDSVAFQVAINQKNYPLSVCIDKVLRKKDLPVWLAPCTDKLDEYSTHAIISSNNQAHMSWLLHLKKNLTSNNQKQLIAYVQKIYQENQLENPGAPDFFNALFSHPNIDFAAFSQEMRIYFLSVVGSHLNRLNWYTYNQTTKMNGLCLDLAQLGCAQQLPDVFQIAQQKGITFEQPDQALLVYILKSGLTSVLDYWSSHQPNTIVNAVTSANITDNEIKWALIMRKPGLFVNHAQACYNVFSQKDSLGSYHDLPFTGKVALAWAKAWIEKEKEPENIIACALHLQTQWAANDTNPKQTELMLKIAKNRILYLGQEKIGSFNQNTPHIADFMKIHRIKRSIFCCVPIPSTLFATPSTRMYNELVRALQLTDSQKKLFASETTNTEAAVTTMLSR